MKSKVILITGASSGIGYDTAALLAKQGHKVYCGARRVEKMEPLREYGVVPMALDVTDESLVKAAVDQVFRTEGRIDVLINNAGYGHFGSVEDVPISDAKTQFDVNVFGLAAITRQVLPMMRNQQSGTIINISSVAGRTSGFMGAWYIAAKHSVEALSDALRMETKEFGINVVLIEPGGVKTAWGMIAAEHLAAFSKGGAYEKAAMRSAEHMKKYYSGNMLSEDCF